MSEKLIEHLIGLNAALSDELDAQKDTIKDLTVQVDEARHQIDTARSPLFEALAKAQAQFKEIRKNKTATVRMKSGGAYEYSYADLASVLEAIRKPLADNGLSIIQHPKIRDGWVSVMTVLAHSSGQSIRHEISMPFASIDPQVIGSAMTYARRYSLNCLVCIASDDDDDGAGAQSGENPTEKPRSGQSGQKPPKSTKTPAKKKGRQNRSEGPSAGVGKGGQPTTTNAHPADERVDQAHVDKWADAFRAAPTPEEVVKFGAVCVKEHEIGQINEATLNGCRRVAAEIVKERWPDFDMKKEGGKS